MRKTKIICTIGPASEHEDVLTRMIKAGMDVARLNFSHGSHEEHQGKIDLIKKVRQKLHMPIAIMLDTKGPEYRIKTLFGKFMLFLSESVPPAITSQIASFPLSSLTCRMMIPFATSTRSPTFKSLIHSHLQLTIL